MASKADRRSGHAFLQTREKPDVADTAWAAIERFFRTELGR